MNTLNKEEVALREALAQISLAERDTTTPAHLKVRDMARIAREALAQQPAAEAYNRQQIAWELERTAMGDGFYGEALRVAKDLPEATPQIRSLLDRWATGRQEGVSDRTDLCAFALSVYGAKTDGPPAAVDGPYRLIDGVVTVNGIALDEVVRLGDRYAGEIEKRGMPRAAQVFEALVMIGKHALATQQRGVK